MFDEGYSICFSDQCPGKLTGTSVQVETGQGRPAQSSGRESDVKFLDL